MIELNEKYFTGLISNSDLHAGGVFFSIIYKNCLEFFSDHKVVLTKKVVDAFRPLDSLNVKRLENFHSEGKYFYNNNGYIVCEFNDLYLTYTGMPTDKNPSIISFHIYDSRLSHQWSEVYQLENIN